MKAVNRKLWFTLYILGWVPPMVLIFGPWDPALKWLILAWLPVSLLTVFSDPAPRLYEDDPRADPSPPCTCKRCDQPEQPA